jgi:hypothetical protein
MYAVESETEALGQIEALPADVLPAYAELMSLLEIAPWSGEPFNRKRLDGALRTHPFGAHGQGLAIYLVLEEQRRVVVVRVLWAG